jgi:ATP-dependent Lon protease
VNEARTKPPPLVVVVAQKSPDTEEPIQSDLHSVGCIAEVMNRVPHIQGGDRVILHGQARAIVLGLTSTRPCLRAKFSRLPREAWITHPQRTLVEEIREGALRLARGQGAPPDALEILEQIREPENLVDLVAGNLEAPVDLKARWLAAPLAERITLVLDSIRRKTSREA